MRLALGIDVGGTTIKSAFGDAEGNLYLKSQTPTPTGATALVEEIKRIRDSKLEQLELSREQGNGDVPPTFDLVEVIGVAVPGVVDERSGTAVLSVNLGWKDAPMKAMLEADLKTSVAFGHDVRCGALAESVWGQAGPDSIFLAIGTGIAAGIIVDGEPLVGGGWAGEVGQILLADPANSEYSLPIERIASAKAIRDRYCDRASVDVSEVNGARSVFDRAHRGDEIAEQIIAEACEALAEIVVNSVSIFGRIKVVVGGGLSNAGPDLLNPLRQGVRRRIGVLPEPDIIGARLGSWAQTKGIAWKALHYQEEQ